MKRIGIVLFGLACGPMCLGQGTGDIELTPSAADGRVYFCDSEGGPCSKAINYSQGGNTAQLYWSALGEPGDGASIAWIVGEYLAGVVENNRTSDKWWSIQWYFRPLVLQDYVVYRDENGWIVGFEITKEFLVRPSPDGLVVGNAESPTLHLMSSCVETTTGRRCDWGRLPSAPAGAEVGDRYLFDSGASMAECILGAAGWITLVQLAGPASCPP